MLTLMIAPPNESLARVLRVVHAGVAAAELRCVCGQWLVCDSDAGRDAALNNDTPHKWLDIARAHVDGCLFAREVLGEVE